MPASRKGNPVQYPLISIKTYRMATKRYAKPEVIKTNDNDHKFLLTGIHPVFSRPPDKIRPVVTHSKLQPRVRFNLSDGS